MLVKEDKLNLEEFKKIYKDLEWLRVPRTLGVDHSEYFYVGKKYSDDHRINVQVRPTMRMKVAESFKKYDRNGKEVDPKRAKEVFWFGSTVEVVIDNSVLDKIKEIAVEKKEDLKQKVSW